MLVSVSRSSITIGFKRFLKSNINGVCAFNLSKNVCTMIENIDEVIKHIAPSLNKGMHKGLAGRIGVFGGSFEYTGAPYFSAISALKLGADLAHVFCTRDAAPVIKSYSPELIVHPLLDARDAAAKIEPWMDRLHVVVIGPGLGRDVYTFKVVCEVLVLCRLRQKPLVIDADGLNFVAQYFSMLNEYPAPIILTPNVAEFGTLTQNGEGRNKQEVAWKYLKLADNVTFLCKGQEDEIFNGSSYVTVSGGGSGRRCGGQGDLLSGATATFLYWALQSFPANKAPILASYAASKLARACNEKAFAKHGRSMICSDMICEIHRVFDELFETKNE